jgi:hypothetical protein
MVQRLALFSVAIALVGCGEIDELSSSEQAARCASVLACGANSPFIKVYSSFHFNLRGRRNEEGISVLGLTKDGLGYELSVSNGRISGRIPGVKPWAGGLIEDQALVGARIWLQARSGEQFGIIINGVAKLQEVVLPHDELQTYVLDWTEVTGNKLEGPVIPGVSFVENPIETKPTAVCTNVTPLTGAAAELDESMSMTPYESLVFEGDLIRADEITVDPVTHNDWFNIGCSYHTIAKIRLTRNTMNTTGGNWQRVQTALKMLSADYGGDGNTFTVAGTPIAWRDQGEMVYWREPRELEARWNERGAMCIENPRFATLKDVQTAYPNLDLCSNMGFDTDPESAFLTDELITSANY